jgi:hypothetical protein
VTSQDTVEGGDCEKALCGERPVTNGFEDKQALRALNVQLDRNSGLPTGRKAHGNGVSIVLVGVTTWKASLGKPGTGGRETGMKDLHPKGRKPRPRWMVLMAASPRKTMVACKTCHEDITYGRPMRRKETQTGFMHGKPVAKP